MPCPGFKSLLEWEADQLRQSDGDELETIAQNASDWRQLFCRRLCEHGEGCELAAKFFP